ncbi:MAG: right-handed parallel beta-helix repeat-containing protein, partial [Thermoplasmata archaeon]|nr:right-handed parallel beta-helix repeat-containing protein [Thermoplasmata archaeon]
MYKKILYLFVVFILLFSCFTFISHCEDTKPTTRAPGVLEVGADMPYQSIQEAINASESGDTIYVHSGIYTEPLNITKSITLVGADKEITAISLNEYWPNGNINITVDSVTIKNFTINLTRHGYGMTGIRLYGVKNCILSNNIISVGYSNGIHIYDSKNITIENNTIFYNWRAGIKIESSEYITIKNNSIFENEEFGIALVASNNNLIMNNNISSHYRNGLKL